MNNNPILRFVVVQWPDSQIFIEGGQGKMYLAASNKACAAFGESAYFVRLDHFETVSGRSASDDDLIIFVPVSFPESGKIDRNIMSRSYDITDSIGIMDFGPFSYFVPEKDYELISTTILTF